MKNEQKSGFFATVYLKEFFTRLRVYLSDKGFKFYIFSKFLELLHLQNTAALKEQ
ncbi:MAG: hypothetical protein ACTSQP_09625 [Promethearchaeota archaeon]